MAPQFVDFNNDGHIDIVTATFDGSPWVAYGTEKGFKQPQHILDKNGERIYLAGQSGIRDAADKTGGVAPQARCCGAFAFDWNGNGVLDLLLSDYRTGFLFVQINEGTAAEPKFSGTNVPVMLGDRPLRASPGIANVRMVDWDGDGLPDLMVGTFGNSRVHGANGGVLWFRNIGKPGEPKFEAARTLINFSAELDGEVRPNRAVYFDVVDYNGNGKLDIIVGTYSTWMGDVGETPRDRFRRVGAIWVYAQKGEGEESDRRTLPGTEQ